MALPFRESVVEAWRRRYGADPPHELPDLGAALNHRSVRKFKPDTILAATKQALIAAAQSAATSSNLQLWSVVDIADAERREQIAHLCADQNQVRTAAWFLAFVADHHRIREAGRSIGEECLGLDYAEFLIMAIIDASLAAERMVCAAESLGIGTCYIGALRNDPVGVADLLSLPEGAFGVFGLCLGYPEEPMTAAVKPRLPQAAIWHHETYQGDTAAEVETYDEQMQTFYAEQLMKGDVTWSMRSGRRVDEHHLSGREVLLEHLRAQGFILR